MVRLAHRSSNKVFIVNSNAQYDAMFNEADGYEVTDDVVETDMIQFTGGSDVTPSYYGEKPHLTTYNSPERDKREAKIFKATFLLGIPMAGICRGGQFLHVMNGGKLYQNVDGHCHSHMVRDVRTDEKWAVSSTHHQMMRDAYVEDGSINTILAVADGVSEYKESMVGKRVVRSREWPVYDLEALFYPITQSLCFQPHPEFNGVAACRDLYFKYLDEFIFNTE